MISRYYKILNIPETSGEKQIKEAYRKLAKKYHPDINKSANSHERFLEISEAYEILINQKRVQAADSSSEQSTKKKSPGFYEEQQRKYRVDREEARRRAQEHARMRYEKFKMQHEAFQKSGLYDIKLLFKYVFRLLVLLVPLFVVYKTAYWIRTDKAAYFLPVLIIAWIANVFIIHWLIKNRKSYLDIGSFYYSLNDVKKIFSEKQPTNQKCCYCIGLPADSIPFRLELIKEKGLKLKSTGVRQHNVNYKNDYVKIEVPRSRKALIVHTINSVVKILSLVFCLFIFHFDSKIWRIIVGVIVGGFASKVILFATRTKSNTSYLFNIKLLIKQMIWMIVIILASDFEFHPVNIISSSYIQIIITGILFFDSFLEQILKTIFRDSVTKPIVLQPEQIRDKFRSGYQLYNDIPIWTVVFPFYKWVLG